MGNRKHFSQTVADAIDKAGGVAVVARAMDVEHQTVREWYIGDRRVPPLRCPHLAHLSGVSLDALRPDLIQYWRSVKAAA